MNPNDYASTEWFCFEPQEFELLNDSYIHGAAKSTSINVGYCADVATALGEPGENCITD